MSLAVARQVDDQPCVPAPYLSLSEVAERLGCSFRHARRLCDERWEPDGLAKKFNGIWGVHPGADARLRTDRDLANRDHQQLADLRGDGMKPRFLELAQRRRDIVAGFLAFALKHRGVPVRRRVRLYLGSLQAENKIGPTLPIKRLAVTTFYRWQSAYLEGGIKALAPGYGGGDGSGSSIGGKAWECFLRWKHSGHRTTIREAHRLTAGEIEVDHKGESGWEWPGYNTVRAAYTDRVTLAERTWIDEGPHKFRAKCLPKITRSLEDIPAGSHLCGDQRILDFMCRVPADVGAWRRIRPKFTAWMDVRSRMVVGWYLGASANSDTILSPFKMACEEMGTLPDEATIDNGKDYRSVAGRTRRHRKWDEFDSKRVSSAFERLGVTVHYAIVKHPWSKSIESRFNTLKDRIDKFVASYWGGSPTERPWDADCWTRSNIEALPTVEEASDMMLAALTAIHEEPVKGDGMFGLCPRQAMRQFYTSEPRPARSEMLEIACCRMHGPVKVGRDGIRHNHIRYGKFDQAVWRLQGKDVWFLSDPVKGDRITLCDKDGVPLPNGVAFADRNLGITQDEIRSAAAEKRKAEKIVKKYPDARDALLRTPVQRIARLRKAAAKAQQIPDDQLTPPPRAERIRLVRPDIAAAANMIKKAAGMESMRQLHTSNTAADGVNTARRVVDFAQFAEDGDEPSTPVRRVVDFSRLANKGAPDDGA